MSSRFFGQYLLEKGRITSQQLLDALDYQKNITLPIGTMALERGLMNAEQIKQVLQQQNRSQLRFGEIAVALGFLTQAQVNEILQDQEMTHRVRLGEALVTRGSLTLEALEKELRAYNDEAAKFAVQAYAGLAAVAHKEIVRTFTDLMLMMFTRFGKQDIIIERCESGKENLRLFRWIIAQKIAGDNLAFSYLLSVPPKILLQMASTMLDENVISADELTLDASKEFVNIANGNACSKLSEHGFALTMTPPEIFETTTRPYTAQGKELVCVHLAAPDAKLEVAFAF